MNLHPIEIGPYTVRYSGSFLSEPGEDIIVRPFVEHTKWKAIFRTRIDNSLDRSQFLASPTDNLALLIEWVGPWDVGNAGSSSSWIAFAQYESNMFYYKRLVSLIGRPDKYAVSNTLTIATKPAADA